MRQLSEGLLGSEENLRLTPRLAVEVPTIENGGISADGLTYTFKLRNGLIWSDDVPLTAQDFEYTFKRVLSPDVLAPYASLYSAILGGEEHLLSAEESPDVKAGLRKVVGVSAATENILVITLADPDPTLLQKLALAAASSVRQDVIEMYGANWTEPGNYLGNGIETRPSEDPGYSSDRDRST